MACGSGSLATETTGSEGRGVTRAAARAFARERAGFAEDLGPVAQRISIRNAAFCEFSPLFMRLVAVVRIEALFLDQVSAWLYPVET